MEKRTLCGNPSYSPEMDAIFGAIPQPLAPAPALASALASASTPGDARDLSQYNFFQSADLGQFPGPSSRVSSRASSFGSMDSGVSHPPRARRARKKVVGMKYSDLTRRASDTHLSRTFISDTGRNTAHKVTDFNQFSDDMGLTDPERWKDPACFQLLSHARYPEASRFDVPPPPFSYGRFCTPLSNVDPYSFHHHYSDPSDPPNLYESLQGEHSYPPPEDMNPADPDLVPRQQELRFEGDLYTPRWIRGFGNKREGWCGICKSGSWLVLKNSAFWYDKSFTHGVCAVTGRPFQEPKETRRMDGNPDVWEGLCDSCDEWIALVSSRKKGTTWFRHAYKCHNHKRVKDSPNGLMPSQSVARDTPVSSSTSSSTGTTTATGKCFCCQTSFP